MNGSLFSLSVSLRLNFRGKHTEGASTERENGPLWEDRSSEGPLETHVVLTSIRIFYLFFVFSGSNSS